MHTLDPSHHRIEIRIDGAMKFSLIAGLSAFLAPAAAASIFNGFAPDVAVNEDLKIPGESPLELCPGEHKHDLITIESVDLSPNPPKPYGLPYSAIK